MSEESVYQTAAARDVFVSYASQDVAVANSVVDHLERQGIRCWIAPRDVKPGAQYADAIVRAINEARTLVLILSESAVGSSHVGREIERAASKLKQIIALKIDTAPLTPALEYFLSESQWIHVAAMGMPAALSRLSESIGQASAPTSSAIGAATSSTANLVSLKGLRSGPFSKRIVVAALVVGVAIAVGVGIHFWSIKAQMPAVAAVSDKSIAVLPFTDMSEKKDQEYFADGMAEEIIDLLAKVPDLHVPARTSSFYFKGRPTKVPDIARELSVANVLEGSVRRSGNQLRVTAQLIRADSGFHLWSETYDRDLSDVFKVQDDIANAVVQALQISLMGGPLTQQEGGTQNLEAYQLFLRAVSAIQQNNRASEEAARVYCERAIKLDPNFALAWTELGWATSGLTLLGALPVAEGNERTRQLAQHALLLSPDIIDGHLLLGYIHRVYDWDWAAAEAEGRQALAIDPNDSGSLQNAALLAETLGRWDDSERQARSALLRDPLNPDVYWALATTFYRSGRLTDAEAAFRKIISVAPDYSWAHEYLAKTLLAQRKPEAALAMLQLEAAESDRLDLLPIVLQATGRQAEADSALKALTTKYADTDAYAVAMNYAYRGDLDLALAWLDRAYRQKDIGFVEIIGEPLFKNLANDPRYKTFLKKMNLLE